MPTRHAALLGLALVLAAIVPVATAAPETPRAPTVYISGPGVDLDYIRREIGFVDYVRDRAEADVHVLVSRRTTATNGSEYELEFIGQRAFAARRDTLTFYTADTATEDDRRSEMVRVLKIGLVPYAARFPVAADLAVTYDQPVVVAEPEDPWNNWWYSVSGHTSFNGERGYRRVNFWGSANAQRITEDLKIELDAWANYNESRFDYESYQGLSINRGKGGEAEVYFSLGDHWSWGFESWINSSEYSNVDWAVGFKPGLEFNVFPYDESSRRRLSFTYEVAGKHVDYIEETIYDETAEALYYHSLRARLALVQPWGSVNFTVRGNQFFHDLGKHRLSLNSNMQVNLFGGFSFNVSGGYSLVHDQLALRKGEASDEELLLRRRELETSYNYWSSVGLSYSFGSQNNNVVNPRF